MRKIIGLALTAAAALAASLPALADSKSAAQFVLKTCLPAMDDLSNKLFVSTWINEKSGMLRTASWGC